jgi:hypothetical protein
MGPGASAGFNSFPALVDLIRSGLTESDRNAPFRTKLDGEAMSDGVAEVVAEQEVGSIGRAKRFRDSDRRKGQLLSSPQPPTLS